MARHQPKELRAAGTVQCLCWPLLLCIAILAAPARCARSQRAARLRPAGLHDDPLDEQCFPWSMNHSIAREDFAYVDPVTHERRQARRGELIPLRCDGVVCPNPKVENCYMREEEVCGTDSWCMLQDQVRFGPWAMANGETPNVPVGSDDIDCQYYKDNGFDFLFQDVCGGQTHWGPWAEIRGRCVPFRQEQQSCNAFLGAESSWASLGGGGIGTGCSSDLVHYVVGLTDGRPPRRPLVCAPGLACTGADEPIPNTCVKARPPNVCYQGPWWDSISWCKVSKDLSAPQYTGGLPRHVLEEIIPALLVQLPVERYESPMNPAFWSDPPADTARRLIQNIVRELWPAQYRRKTKFPLPMPDPRTQGPPLTGKWNSTAAAAAKLYKQPNKLWSAIHTLIHNVPDPMSTAAVAASRALAVWLRQHFSCQNCRGFWANDVLNVHGLPPDTSEREQHKRWWWRAHNLVSEHAASTRGGHPWVWLAFDNSDDFAQYSTKFGSPLLKCQNPWFLPYSQVHAMWDITPEVEAMTA